MKRLLFLFVLAVCCSSCITLYFHKNFTYQCDGRNTGIEKHMRIDGYYDVWRYGTYKGVRDSSVGLMIFYRDGSFARSTMGFPTLKQAEEEFDGPERCYLCNVGWGQSRVWDTMLVTQMMYMKEAGRFAIYSDTFSIIADTILEKRWRNGTKSRRYYFHPSAIRPDSTLADIRSHNWYWTKAYKDSVRYASWHRHR